MQVESSIKHLPESHTDEQCGTELQKKKRERERQEHKRVRGYSTFQEKLSPSSVCFQKSLESSAELSIKKVSETRGWPSLHEQSR